MLLLLLGAGGATDAHDEGDDATGCARVSPDIAEYRTLVSHHPWSGRAWQVTARGRAGARLSPPGSVCARDAARRGAARRGAGQARHRRL